MSATGITEEQQRLAQLTGEAPVDLIIVTKQEIESAQVVWEWIATRPDYHPTAEQVKSWDEIKTDSPEEFLKTRDQRLVVVYNPNKTNVQLSIEFNGRPLTGTVTRFDETKLHPTAGGYHFQIEWDDDIPTPLTYWGVEIVQLAPDERIYNPGLLGCHLEIVDQLVEAGLFNLTGRVVRVGKYDVPVIKLSEKLAQIPVTERG